MFAGLVAELEGMEVGAVAQRVRELEVARRRLEGELDAALAELDRRRYGDADGFASVTAWCRAVLGWSGRECRARMQLVRLIAEFGEVGDELLDGTLPVANAEAIARAWANPRVRDRFPDVLGQFLNDGCRLEYDDFCVIVDHFVTLADVDGAHRDRDHSHQHRSADFVKYQGQGTLIVRWGDMDTAINKQVYDQFVQAEWDADWAWTVEQYGDDACVARMPRTDAQRRADAVSAIMRRAGATATGKPGKVVTNIHIDWQNWRDLMAWAELFPERACDPFEAADTLISQWRCNTIDGMLLDPVAVLQASLEGYVRFVILDDDGVPIRWGRERRLFQGAARDAVMMLAPHCTHPGCRVPTSRSQADHLTPWAHGGVTNPDNGGPHAAATTDGATTATSPNDGATCGTPTAPTAPRSADLLICSRTGDDSPTAW